MGWQNTLTSVLFSPLAFLSLQLQKKKKMKSRVNLTVFFWYKASKSWSFDIYKVLRRHERTSVSRYDGGILEEQFKNQRNKTKKTPVGFVFSLRLLKAWVKSRSWFDSFGWAESSIVLKHEHVWKDDNWVAEYFRAAETVQQKRWRSKSLTSPF